ncbi:hypothetical protein WT08_12530 [Burkholderia sp. MSMB1552]|nr:hypothetical protein WT08_12530 [Burkholderia sp. MSMB1552]KWZ50666.1 hypothetical protein WS92_25205 [Burkholderia sp. MSMB1588]
MARASDEPSRDRIGSEANVRIDASDIAPPVDGKPARVTLRSSSSASNALSRLKSSVLISTMLIGCCGEIESSLYPGRVADSSAQSAHLSE